MSRKNLRSLSLIAASIITVASMLSGCSGGSSGTSATNSPVSTNGIISARNFTNDDLNNVIPTGVILKASIPGKNPVVDVQVVDKVSGAGITGLKTFGLHIAKLVPEANGSSSYWVNYIDKGISLPAPLAFAVANGKAVTGAITKPSADPGTTLVTSSQNGLDLTKYPVGSVLLPGYTVVDHGDGTYTITFGSDITSNSNAPYDANAITRIGVTVTSIATPGVTATGPLDTTGAVNTSFQARNRLAMVYDFTPATGAIYTNPNGGNYVRDIVTTAACNGCHDSIAFTDGGHSARPNTQLCVMCHTSTNTSGEGEFVTFIHRLHMGGNLPAAVQAESVLNPSKPLAKTTPLVTYNLSATVNGFPLVDYPQDIRNCTTCHKGVDGANWSTKTTLKNCGSCHNAINFATGAGTTNDGNTIGHIGGAQANDNICTLCHASGQNSPSATHVTIDTATNAATSKTAIAGPNVQPAGAAKISYSISSVTRSATTKNPSITFTVKNGTTPLVFGNYSAQNLQRSILPNAVSSPSVYFIWAQPQDKISTPADFNATASVSLLNAYYYSRTDATPLAPASPSAAATLVANSDGSYTITATGITVPDTAVMLTGAIGFGAFTEIDVPGYTYNTTTRTGGVSLTAPIVEMVATGYSGRRQIVSTDKCNSCHDQLGISPTFHSGVRNTASSCAYCHNPNRAASNGWAIDSSSFVHGIHAAAQRSVPYGWQNSAFATVTYPGYLRNCEQCHLSGTYDFTGPAYTNALLQNLLYSTVATSGSYVTNLSTKVAGVYAALGTVNPAAFSSTTASPYVTNGTTYGPGYTTIQPNPVAVVGAGPATAPIPFTIIDAAPTTLVNSPIASACFSCHDTAADKAHMVTNGGSIAAPRSSALATQEACLACHGGASNTVNATVPTIKAVHRWW